MRTFTRAITGALFLSIPSMASAYGPLIVGGTTLMFNGGLNTTTGGFHYYNGYGSYSDVADNGSRVDLLIGAGAGGFVEASGSGNTESNAYGSFQYNFRVDGSGPLNAFGMVEMRVTTKGITNTTGFYQALAGISLTPDPLYSFDYYLPIAFSFNAKSCSGSTSNCTGGFNGADGWDVTDFVFYMWPNRDYTLTMGASVEQRQPDSYSISHGGPGTLRSGTAYAYVDPVIKIAPGVSGFTISNGGPSMQPVGGVPEPSSWAMLIAGFGLVGGLSRRRRSLPRAAG
jgi:hypothetical protein